MGLLVVQRRQTLRRNPFFREAQSLLRMWIIFDSVIKMGSRVFHYRGFVTSPIYPCASAEVQDQLDTLGTKATRKTSSV